MFALKLHLPSELISESASDRKPLAACRVDLCKTPSVIRNHEQCASLVGFNPNIDVATQSRVKSVLDCVAYKLVCQPNHEIVQRRWTGALDSDVKGNFSIRIAEEFDDALTKAAKTPIEQPRFAS